MTSTDPATSTLEQVQICCRALYAKKAENITILHLGTKSTVADYFVIATGTSDPHLRALGSTVVRTLKDHQVALVGADRSPGSGWVVVDAGDFFVHVFTPEVRAHYNLEGLWKDAKRLEVALPASRRAQG